MPISFPTRGRGRRESGGPNSNLNDVGEAEKSSGTKRVGLPGPLKRLLGCVMTLLGLRQFTQPRIFSRDPVHWREGDGLKRRQRRRMAERDDGRTKLAAIGAQPRIKLADFLPFTYVQCLAKG